LESDDCSSWELPQVGIAGKRGLLTPDYYKQEEEAKRLLLQHEKEQARLQGLEIGKKEGMSKGLEMFHDRIKDFESLLLAFGTSVSGLTPMFEKQIKDLSISIARAIIMHEITISDETINNLVLEALKKMPSKSSEIHIHLHKTDYNSIKKIIKEEGMDQFENVNLLINDAINMGGCIVESNVSNIDASLEQRFSNLISELEEEQ
jgi:flagellar assembly protein FliH